MSQVLTPLYSLFIHNGSSKLLYTSQFNEGSYVVEVKKSKKSTIKQGPKYVVPYSGYNMQQFAHSIRNLITVL
jgi:hypothetical protein